MTIFYGVDDDYSVELAALATANSFLFPCSDPDDPYDGTSSTLFPANDPLHQLVPRNLNLLTGARIYSRHGARSNAMLRSPYCSNGLDLFYNHNFYNSGPPESCNDQVPNVLTTDPNDTKPFLSAIIDPYHANKLPNGTPLPMEVWLYQNIASQFFYEIQNPTNVTSSTNTWQGSNCLCRSKSGWENNGTLPITFDLDNIGLVNPLDPDDLTYGFLSETGGDNCPSSHFMCINCENWRNLLIERFQHMASFEPKYFSIDEWPMPALASACHCLNCHNLFQSNTFFCPSGSCPDYTQHPDSSLFGKNHLHADFMNFSMVQHINALNGALSTTDTRLVNSVRFLSALNEDAYRTDVARICDIPKTEFNMPIRNTQNDIFRGSYFTPATTNYASVLNNYMIPEDIRLAAGLQTVRDAAPTRVVHVWLPPEGFKANENINEDDLLTPLPINEADIDLNGTIDNYSVWNNRRITTALGASYAYGNILNMTFGKPLIGPYAAKIPESHAGQSIWDVSDYIYVAGSPPNIQNANPEAANIIPIFKLDEKIGNYFHGMRPYNWASVYFSERERNRYLYLDDLGQHPTLETRLLNVQVWPLTTFQVAQREALAWLNQLFPFHVAYQSLFNSNALVGEGDYWLKYPIAIVNDNHIANGSILGSKGLLIPCPANQVVSTLPSGQLVNGTITQLHLETIDQLNNTLIDIPKVFIGYNNDRWYSSGNEITNAINFDQIRTSTEALFNGKPPIYVVGTTPNAATVHAGFFVPTSYSMYQNMVLVAMSVQPVFGLPRNHALDNDPMILSQYGEDPLVV
jgi:hypothetical protein